MIPLIVVAFVANRGSALFQLLFYDAPRFGEIGLNVEKKYWAKKDTFSKEAVVEDDELLLPIIVEWRVRVSDRDFWQFVDKMQQRVVLQ